MAWDETQSANDSFKSVDWNNMVIDQKSRSKVSTAAGAPSSTPSMVGAIYYDSTNGKFYMSAGTSGASDWKKVITQ